VDKLEQQHHRHAKCTERGMHLETAPQLIKIARPHLSIPLSSFLQICGRVVDVVAVVQIQSTQLGENSIRALWTSRSLTAGQLAN
jgi:hypothetical protein